MTRIRVAILGLAAMAFMLAWALPALAHPTHAAGTVVTVSEGSSANPFSLKLSTNKVAAGTVTFKVKNTGVGLPHDFSINGKKTAMLSPGKSATLVVTFKKGSYKYQCTVPGHAAGGMKGVLTVS
jgi:uncharacterized cupredoxin-like copper-binding protein